MPWDVLVRLISPDLLPDPTTSVRSRLRFYELRFRPLRPSRHRELEARDGRFREGALGVPVLVRGTPGEVSAFLWTDSEEYLMWGREVFGWPVRLAHVKLSGDVWYDDVRLGATGAARLSDSWGSASLLDLEILEEAVDSGTPSGLWLTPRRLVHHDGGFHESRELLAVRPDVRRTGTTYAGRGRVAFNFAEPHPLAAMDEHPAVVELADDFELHVGGDVSLLAAPERGGSE
jgi:hypothetical protein